MAATLIEAIEEHEAAKTFVAIRADAEPLSLVSLIPADSSQKEVQSTSFGGNHLTPLLIPFVVDPHVPLSIGNTRLHFSWREVLTFFGAPCNLYPWDRVCAFFAGKHPPVWSHMPAFLASARQSHDGHNPMPDEFWCYTDGSFTPSTDDSPCRMGWATVFVQPTATAVYCAWGRVPADLQEPIDSGSAFVAECYALLVGALVAVNHFNRNCVHFLSDCQSALAIVSGHAAWTAGGLAEAAAGAHSLRRMTAPVPDRYGYVPGHTGVLPNEVADFLSKSGSLAEESCGLQVSSADRLAWLGQGGPKLPWVGVAIRALLRDPAYPPLNSPSLGNDRNHGSLSPADLIRPFAPPGALETDL